ncbi:MAG TPA: rhodanese-like domain-containing protein [Hydrogenophaga sp.]|uniref:rhodanese-like domain-containing protein n=1 Tax=Hydrogenophaga sp. TaxID=1904254 RepID=UPI002C131100|nr:rhodanese-like domain-containing protein [Hydrogenophaga sp.]HMN94645.1 rhodanese-like domain-containing protein [Hydrogenophaga sp.]HMP11648.1 rhodanese-like domain-containing protein [Hydrogenophaga sp.]
MNKRSLMKCTAAFAFSLIAVTPVWAAETPPTLAGAKVIQAEEAKKLLDGGVPFYDTRVAAEYAEKTIKGAHSLVYRERSAKSADFDASQDQFDLTKLPANKAAPVVFFCNAGTCWRSYKAAAVAVKAGHTQVHWFRGGMPEWTAKGLPTQ